MEVALHYQLFLLLLHCLYCIFILFKLFTLLTLFTLFNSTLQYSFIVVYSQVKRNILFECGSWQVNLKEDQWA